jgi:hypothetical protein
VIDDGTAPSPSAATAKPAGPLPISFRNPLAVRTASLTALLVWLLITIPIGGAFGLLLRLFLLAGGGFLSVVLYARWTGEPLSILSGARLGWITGVLFFVLAILYFTIHLVEQQQNGGILEAWRQQLKESNTPQQDAEELMRILDAPGALPVFMLLTLAIMFGFFTLPMIAGGALAAKMLERNQAAS